MALAHTGTADDRATTKQHGHTELHSNHALRSGPGSINTWNRKTIWITLIVAYTYCKGIISAFRSRSFMVVVNRTCVSTYVEKDSKCDLATESRSIMSDINRTLDTYVMRCSRMIYKYHFLARPPL
jgi:hypothetical protein